MGKWQKLGTNVILMSIGSIGSKLITFLMVPFYTAVLSTQDYGIADLIFTTVNLLAPLFTMTVSEAVLRFALDKSTDDRQVLTIGLSINTIGAVVLLCLSPLIGFIPSLQPYVGYFILYYLSYTFYNLVLNFTNGIGKVSLYTFASICQTIVLVVANIVSLLVFKLGIQGYLLSYVISYFCATLILFFGGKEYHYWTSPFQIKKEEVTKMMKYSLPMIPNTISWWVSNSSDKYMLAAICGVTINGIYSVAYKIPTILSVVFSIFMSAWRLSAVDDFGSKECQNFYSSVYRKIEGGIVIVAAGIILLNKYLASLLFSNEFYVAWVFVPVLVIAFMLHGLGEFFGSIYTSAQKTSVLFYSSFTGAICNVVMNAILIPLYGGLGAAIATLLSYLIILIFRMVHSRKIMPLHINVLHSITSFLLLLGMCIIQTVDIKYSFGFSSFIFLIIILVEKKLIVDVWTKVIQKIKRMKIDRRR